MRTGILLLFFTVNGKKGSEQVYVRRFRAMMGTLALQISKRRSLGRENKDDMDFSSG